MRKRILVADHNELMRRQIRRILESDLVGSIDRNMSGAANGTEAVRKAHEYSPHLVLIDAFVPDMRGLAAAGK